jgi:hypothetical protein
MINHIAAIMMMASRIMDLAIAALPIWSLLYCTECIFPTGSVCVIGDHWNFFIDGRSLHLIPEDMSVIKGRKPSV